MLYNLERSSGVEKTALEYGVHGFLYQGDTAETLLRGLLAVFNGELWVSRHKIAEMVTSSRKLSVKPEYLNDLTPREVEILRLLTVGATNKVIAEKLCISPHTVRTHLHHIFAKIGVSNRLEATVWAASRSRDLTSRSSTP